MSDLLENLSSKELNDLRKEVVRIGKDRPYVVPGVKLFGYLPEGWAQNLRIAVEIAYENKLITKKTEYALINEAVKAYINAVIRKKIESQVVLDG